MPHLACGFFGLSVYFLQIDFFAWVDVIRGDVVADR
jgi:hypothetical protein